MRPLLVVQIGLGCLLALAPPARAEWTVWGRSDGLIDDRVTSLYQDLDGTLWVGTTVGISHYDGATWRSFGPADGLPARDAEQFLRDRSGVLWVGTHDGMYRSADGSRFTPADGVLVTSRRVFEDRDGNLWFATGGGVYRLAGVTLTRFTWADGLANNEVRGISQDRSGAMWFATDGGVSRYDGATWRTYTPLDGLANGDVTSMLEDRHGALWFGSNGHGVTRYDGSAWRIFTSADGLPSDYVTGLFEDRSGELWMWSALGTASFDGSRWHSLDLLFGYPGNLESALEDRSGALWFAQYNVGVARYDRSSWRTFTEIDGLGRAQAYRIDEDRTGALWFIFSFAAGGVTRFDGETWRTFTTADGLAGDVVFRVYQDRAGWIWFPTDQGMSRFDGTTWQTFTQAGGTNLYGRFDRIAEDRGGGIWFGGDGGSLVRYDGSTWVDFPAVGSVNAIAVDSAGAVWVGSSDGAQRYDGSNWVAYPELGAGQGGVWRLVVDHSGSVWAGTAEGVARFEGGSWRSFGPADGVPYTSVTQLLVDVQGRVWAGTSGAGVWRFDGISWRIFSSADGFLAETVKEMFADSSGIVWLATDIGISRFDGTEWGSYGVADGLPDPEAYSAHLAGSGALWVSTFGGVTRHEPDRVPPDVVFTTKPVPVSASTYQSAGFIAAFRESRGVRFSFSFDGAPWSPWSFESSWSAFNIAAGTHVFQVRARDQIGNVDPEPASVTFEVDPAPPVPIVSAPAFAQAIRDSIAIVGTAADLRFREYRIEVRPAGATSWNLLARSTTPVVDGFLAGWNTRSLSDGDYELRLAVSDTLGLDGTARVSVIVDNQEPRAVVTSPAPVSAESGGHVYTTGAEVDVYFPPHAFGADAVVTIDALSDADVPATLPGAVVRVLPGYALSWGSAPLEKPATLELSLAGTTSSPGEPALYLEESPGSWRRVGGTVDGAAHRIAVPLERAGRYALFAGPGTAGNAGQLAGLSLTPRIFSPTGGYADRRIGIGFSLGQSAAVTVKVYNRAGRLVREVARGETMGPGANLAWWDGTDQGGAMVGDGIYLVSVEALGERRTQTLSVVR